MPMNLEECERQARQRPPTDRSVLIEHLIGSLDELDEAECERCPPLRWSWGPTLVPL